MPKEIYQINDLSLPEINRILVNISNRLNYIYASGDNTALDGKKLTDLALGVSGSDAVRYDQLIVIDSDNKVISPSALDMNNTDISNVGDISLDTISSAAGTTITVTLGTDVGDDFTVGPGHLVVEGDKGLTTISKLALTGDLDMNGNDILNVGTLLFDITTPTPVKSEGLVYWNADDGTLNVCLPGGEVVGQLFQEMYIPKRPKNVSGSTMPNGTVVFISGATGGASSVPEVSLADASTEALSARTIGVTTEDILNNQRGYVTTQGLVRGTTAQPIDTSAMSVGDKIYLSETAGEFTGVKPVSPAYTVFIGTVIRSHATEGEIDVRVQNGFELGKLNDVDDSLSAPTDKALFGYNATNSLWEQTPQLIYDFASGNTGVGEASPAGRLSVTGSDVNDAVLRLEAANGQSEDILPLFDDAGAVLSTFDATGRLVIGTDTAISQLTVASDSGVSTPTITIEDLETQVTATGQVIGSLDFYLNDASGPGVGVRASIDAVTEDALGVATALCFSTSDGSGLAEVLRMGSNGQFGFGGVTTPTSIIHVEGQTDWNSTEPIVRFNNKETQQANANVLKVETSALTSDSAYLISGDSASGNIFRLYSNGRTVFTNTTAGNLTDFLVTMNNIDTFPSGAGSVLHLKGGDGDTASTIFQMTKIGPEAVIWETFGDGSTVLTSADPNIVPITIQGAVGQADDLQRWQDDVGSILSRFNESGHLGIGVDPSEELHVVGQMLLAEDSAATNAGSKIFHFQSSGTSMGTCEINNNGSGGAAVVFAKSRGTVSSKTIIQDGDVAGGFIAQGWDGAAYQDLGAVRFKVDGTPGLNDMPGEIVFETTPDGSTSKVQRAAIRQNGTIELGTSTNLIQIESDGDVNFTNGSGLQFGELNVEDNTTETTIAGIGEVNKVQVTVFDTNGESNGDVTPDHTNDHITVGKAGMYLIIISLTAESVAGAAALFGWRAYINNGATALTHVHAHRQLAGGGSDTGSISLSGVTDLAANDTVELWVWNETNTQNIVISDCTVSVVQIGGT